MKPFLYMLVCLLIAGRCVAEQQRPNLIVLLTDDQRHDTLGIADHATIRTPNLDQLAREGVRFTNAYVTDSICSVSRACVLTGQYPIRNGIQVLDTPLSAEGFAQTYPAKLKEAGYRLGHVGKWHLGDVQHGKDLFDDWLGFPGYAVHYDQVDDQGQPIHLTRKLGNQAVSLIDRYAEGDQPFCLNVWFQAPHNEAYDRRNRDAADGYLPDPEFESWYADWIPNKPPTFTEFERSIPNILYPDLELRRRWQRRFEDEEVRIRVIRNYCRLISGVDAAVGRIRHALEESGVSDNTVIVFLSDNGYFLGEHGLGGKFWPHEPSARIPMIWFDPKLAASRTGTTDDHVVLNLDVAPTLLDFAGVSSPDAMQGRSLRNLIAGSAPTDWRKDFYYQHLYQAYRKRDDGTQVPTIPACEGVIGGRMKYFRFVRAVDHREIDGEWPLYECLYDVHEDPFERANLSGHATHFQDLQAMRRRCARLKNDAK